MNALKSLRGRSPSPQSASLVVLSFVLLGGSLSIWAEEPAAPTKNETAAVPADAARFATLAEKLSGSAFEGHFSTDSKPGEFKQDRYELQSVSKLPTGDLWLFKTRIRYGDHDVTVPLPITIKWVDQTPMIVVDSLSIPGLGVFDARVVIAGDRYAGTWQHGDVGGHLFGRITRPATPAKPASDPKGAAGE
jgi:hypothetical protein